MIGLRKRMCSRRHGPHAPPHRIAKLLLFVSLVPEVVPALPPDGTAAYLRRLWRSPEDPSQAIEVQLICGKTLERSLGREAAEQLLDRIKTGAIISVTGRVQPHLPNRGGAAGSGAGGDDAGNGAGGVQGRHAIIDVVAHQVHVLHRNKCVYGVGVGACGRLTLGSTVRLGAKGPWQPTTMVQQPCTRRVHLRALLSNTLMPLHGCAGTCSKRRCV